MGKKEKMLLKFTRIRFLFKTFLALLTIYDPADGNSFFAVFRSCVVRCLGGAAKASGIFQVCLNQVVFQ